MGNKVGNCIDHVNALVFAVQIFSGGFAMQAAEHSIYRVNLTEREVVRLKRREKRLKATQFGITPCKPSKSNP